MSITQVYSDTDKAGAIGILRNATLFPERMGIEQRKSYVSELLEQAKDIYSSGLLNQPDVLAVTRNALDGIMDELKAWDILGGVSANDEEWKRIFQDAA